MTEHTFTGTLKFSDDEYENIDVVATDYSAADKAIRKVWAEDYDNQGELLRIVQQPDGFILY